MGSGEAMVIGCCLVRVHDNDPGAERTSATRSTLFAFSSRTNSSRVSVEWPMVNRVTLLRYRPLYLK